VQRFKQIFPFLIALLLGLHIVPILITGHDLRYFPGDLGDARFNNYILEHCHQFFSGNIASLWDAPFMFPEDNVITYSDNLVGAAPFYSMFRVFGCDRETAFQLWYILMSALSFTATYFFLRSLFKNNYAAIAGAMVFAFSLALQSQVAHAQTFPRFAIPLALWMGVLYMRKLDPKYFFAAVFFVVYEIWCGIYLGFMLSVPVGILLMITFFFNRDEYKLKIRDRKWLTGMTTAVVSNILLLLPLMIPYMDRARNMGLHAYDEILQSLPTLRSFFFSKPGSILWDGLSHTGDKYPAPWDHQVFPGAIAMISLIVMMFFVLRTFLKRKFSAEGIDKQLIVISIVALLTFLLFIRFQGFSFYMIIYKLPGFGSMRALQRIINIELIFFAIATAYMFSLLKNKSIKMQTVFFVLFLALFVVDNYTFENSVYRMEKSRSQELVNGLKEKMKDIPEGSVISYEPDTLESSAIDYQINAMLASQSLKLKCINGYSSTSPKGYGDYWWNPNENTRMTWLREKNDTTMKVFVVR
jgi:hypothetical protein